MSKAICLAPQGQTEACVAPDDSGELVTTPVTTTKRTSKRKATSSKNSTKANKKQKKETHTATLPLSPSPLWENEDALQEICSYLGRTDLHTLLTVNKTFHLAAGRHLYRVVRVRLHKCDCHAPPGRDEGFAKLYTHAVEFFPHQHKNHYPSRLHTPKLNTVILNYDAVSVPSNERDKHNRTTAWGNYRCDKCPKNPPEPKRVVVRPTGGILTYYRGGPPSCKRILLPIGYKKAEKIIHIARFDRHPTYSQERPFRAEPPTTDDDPLPFKLTFVIFPFFWDHGPVVANYNQRFTPGPAPSPVDSALLETLVGLAMQHSHHEVTIVGMEHANPYAPDFHWNDRKEREQHLPDALAKTYTKLAPAVAPNSWSYPGWTWEERDKRLETIRFQTFHDYLTSNAWGPEIDWQLVGRWLNDYEKREKGLFKLTDKKRKELRRLAKEIRESTPKSLSTSAATALPVRKRAMSAASVSSPEWSDDECEDGGDVHMS